MTGSDQMPAARVEPPGVDEIERRFRSPTVVAARPLIRGGVWALRKARRFRWSAEGLELLPAIDGPLIFAANHVSHVDTAAVIGSLPGPIRRRTCVAAALDVFGPINERKTLKWFRRECLQVIVGAGWHAFAFDRSGPPLRSLRTATDLVRRGWSLLLYPEGTRSRSGELAPFKAGVSVVAKKTGRPVVPVHVAGGDAILPCGATLPGPGHARVRFGEPVRLKRGESSQAFAARLRDRVRELGGAPRDAPVVETVAAGAAASLSAVPRAPGDARQPSA